MCSTPQRIAASIALRCSSNRLAFPGVRVEIRSTRRAPANACSSDAGSPKSPRRTRMPLSESARAFAGERTATPRSGGGASRRNCAMTSEPNPPVAPVMTTSRKSCCMAHPCRCILKDGARGGKIAIRQQAIGAFGKADQCAGDDLERFGPYREEARAGATDLGGNRSSEASSLRRADASAFNMAISACSAAGICRRLG